METKTGALLGRKTRTKGSARGFLKTLACAAICVAASFVAGRAGAAEGPLFLPAPQKATWTAPTVVKKAFRISADASVPDSTVREYKTNLFKWGFKDADGGMAISLKRLPASECAKVTTPPYRKTIFLEYPELQAYFLKSDAGAVSVTACGEDGFFYALMTLRNMWKDAEGGVSLYGADITDYPVFPIRGVFEGGYGKWELEGRLKIFEWMGQNKLNSYAYGPKGDSKMRRRWREPYDDLELFGFKRMIDAAKQNHIQFGYTIGPSLGFEYSSEADFKVLLTKIRQIQALGAKNIILAFDDSMGMLYYKSDMKKFKSLAYAEVYVANKLNKALKAFDPETVLVLVPEIYAGVYPMEYTDTIAKTLDRDITIGWTGNEICTPTLNGADVVKANDFYGRMMSFGDNWGGMYPMVGRAPDINKGTTQFLMNPFNLQGELPIPGAEGASLPELMHIQGASLAEFTWNPNAYDPDKTVDAIAELYFEPQARDVFKLVMMKDFYDFNALVSLKTAGYATPLEKEFSAASAAKDPKALAKIADRALPLLEKALTQQELMNSGSRNAEVGAALFKVVNGGKTYFEKLAADLKKVRDAANANDAAALEASSATFLKDLKEEK
ncbi:MAG: beta-N-acetylglucosaminidase domain-containing protein [bacterium]